MSQVIFTGKGDLSRTYKFLNTISRGEFVRRVLEKYGRIGVEALAQATPTDTGGTAASWSYKVEVGGGSARIEFFNSNLGDGWFPIALMLQYGHATGTHGWVEGRDYINPALQPVFDSLVESLGKEVEAA